MSPLDALNIAILAAGGQTAFASALGVKQQRVWNWLNRKGARVPPEHCPAIEGIARLEIRRWDLRPSDWWRIWPELIGTPGAPVVPSGQAVPTAAVPAGAADGVMCIPVTERRGEDRRDGERRAGEDRRQSGRRKGERRTTSDIAAGAAQPGA